jgi:Amt family ammonium transporter
LVIGYIIKFTIGFRISEEDEVTGIDETEHAETGYDFSTLGGALGLSSGHPLATASHSSSGTVAAGKEG